MNGIILFRLKESSTWTTVPEDQEIEKQVAQEAVKGSYSAS